MTEKRSKTLQRRIFRYWRGEGALDLKHPIRLTSTGVSSLKRGIPRDVPTTVRNNGQVLPLANPLHTCTIHPLTPPSVPFLRPGLNPVVGLHSSGVYPLVSPFETRGMQWGDGRACNWNEFGDWSGVWYGGGWVRGSIWPTGNHERGTERGWRGRLCGCHLVKSSGVGYCRRLRLSPRRRRQGVMPVIKRVARTSTSSSSKKKVEATGLETKDWTTVCRIREERFLYSYCVARWLIYEIDFGRTRRKISPVWTA